MKNKNGEIEVNKYITMVELPEPNVTFEKATEDWKKQQIL